MSNKSAVNLLLSAAAISLLAACGTPRVVMDRSTERSPVPNGNQMPAAHVFNETKDMWATKEGLLCQLNGQIGPAAPGTLVSTGNGNYREAIAGESVIRSLTLDCSGKAPTFLTPLQQARTQVDFQPNYKTPDGLLVCGRNVVMTIEDTASKNKSGTTDLESPILGYEAMAGWRLVTGQGGSYVRCALQAAEFTYAPSTRGAGLFNRDVYMTPSNEFERIQLPASYILTIKESTLHNSVDASTSGGYLNRPATKDDRKLLSPPETTSGKGSSPSTPSGKKTYRPVTPKTGKIKTFGGSLTGAKQK